MEEEKAKKKRKKKAATEGEDGEKKEHKPNWREVNATPEEIKAFLSDHICLRYNMVKYRIEARLPPEDPFCQNSELAHLLRTAWVCGTQERSRECRPAAKVKFQPRCSYRTAGLFS